MQGDGNGRTSLSTESVPPALVHDQFDGNEPKTTAELAATMGTPPASVEAACLALVDRGDLQRKRLEGEQETVVVWYRPMTTDEVGDTQESVEDVLAGLSVPGTSEMMRDWRRDAVRAAYEHLCENAPATADDLCASVFRSHAAGYDDESAWLAFLEPRLARLPGVTPPTGERSHWTVDE
ncbi:hypothetical protein [Haloarchaeobius sp. DFWS5]|uniref:hypothetical protein n=1 Tax=Haloarchaeobius sp. DFWS5 TaxID=3446114 RepID=UPI003EBAA4AC